MTRTFIQPQTTQSSRRQRAAHRGFVLLEIILAMALFSLVAVGLTRALNEISKAAQSARKEAMVLRVLESVMAEVSHLPEFKKTSVTFPKTADGVDAAARIEKIELLTKDKVVLDHLFVVRADAWLADGGDQPFKRSMETYVYSPNSEW